jgi:hypothetical protein
MPPSALDLGPLPAHGVQVREDGVAAEMLPETSNSLITPVVSQRPAIKLCGSHEGDPKKMSFQDLPVSRSQRVLLEDVGNDRCIDDDPTHSSSQDEVRRQRSKASSKPSLIWSSGQPPARSSYRVTGRTPCCRASSSGEVYCQKSLALSSISEHRLLSFGFGTGTEHLLLALVYRVFLWLTRSSVVSLRYNPPHFGQIAPRRLILPDPASRFPVIGFLLDGPGPAL